MAEPTTFTLYDADTTAPLAGVVPLFLAYVDGTGAARPPPVLEDLSDGLYRFTPTDGDVDTGVAWLIDASAAAYPRFLSGQEGTRFVSFALYGEDTGEPLAGATVVFTVYEDDAGPRTPPALVDLGGGLYVFTPTGADVLARTRYTVSVTGAVPAFLAGALEPEVVAPPPVPGIVEDFGDALELLATGRYEIRPGVAPVSIGAGRFRPGAPATPIQDELCSVQPLRGDDVQRLPEGDRVDAWRNVYTRYPLSGPDTQTGKAGDVILVDGVPFEVERVNAWGQAAGVTHALVRKVGR